MSTDRRLDMPMSLAVLITLSLSLGVCGLAGEVKAAKPSANGKAPISVTFGPHWRGAMLTGGSETYLCAGGNRFTVRFELVSPPGGKVTVRRRRVRGLEINGVAVGPKPVDSLNEALADFDTEPRFSPQCYQSRFRVHLYEPREGGRSEFVDLAPAPRD